MCALSPRSAPSRWKPRPPPRRKRLWQRRRGPRRPLRRREASRRLLRPLDRPVLPAEGRRTGSRLPHTERRAIGHRVRAMARVCFPTVRLHRRRARVPTLLAPAHRVPFRQRLRCPLRRQPTPQPKDPLQSFPYPLLCAVIFLLAGFCFGWWHPAWVIFLTIPFYYWAVNTLEADPAYQAWLAERQDVATKNDSSSEGGAR